MLRLPKKSVARGASLDSTAEDLKSSMLSIYGDQVWNDMPEHIKIAVEHKFEMVVAKMRQDLESLQQDYERQVQSTKLAAKQELCVYASTGKQVIALVDAAIDEALSKQLPFCRVIFSPGLERPMHSKVELKPNLQAWKQHFFNWATHLDLVLAHLAYLGYTVKTTYYNPVNVQYDEGDDGTSDGKVVDPSWTYQDFGLVTITFDMPDPDVTNSLQS